MSNLVENGSRVVAIDQLKMLSTRLIAGQGVQGCSSVLFFYGNGSGHSFMQREDVWSICSVGKQGLDWVGLRSLA